MLSVGGEDGIGVVAPVGLDRDGLSALDLVEIDAAVGAECVLLACFLAAAVGNVLSVRGPVELLYSSERFGRQFVGFVSQKVDAALRGDSPAHGRKVGARSLGNPVVPVAVHQIVGGIGLSLVEGRVTVFRALYRTGYGADIDDVASVRGELEFADAGRNVAKAASCSQPFATIGSLPELAVHKEVNALSVRSPAGIGDAL